MNHAEGCKMLLVDKSSAWPTLIGECWINLAWILLGWFGRISVMDFVTKTWQSDLPSCADWPAGEGDVAGSARRSAPMYLKSTCHKLIFTPELVFKPPTKPFGPWVRLCGSFKVLRLIGDLDHYHGASSNWHECILFLCASLHMKGMLWAEVLEDECVIKQILPLQLKKRWGN